MRGVARAAAVLALLGAAPSWGAEEEEDPDAEPIHAMACVACHTEEGVAGHVPPAAEGCLACHPVPDPDAEVAPGAHAVVEAQTCGACHEMGGAVQHLPEEAGCGTCHDPHDRGKKRSHIHQKREVDLCYSCHPEQRLDLRFEHTARKLGRCTGCHDPHGSDVPGLLRSADQRVLCGACHADQVTVDKHDHWPAADGQCDVCHAPHGSDHEFGLVLPDKETCYQCHPPKETEVQVHSAVVLGRCAKCHDPHGSDHDRKLRGDPVGQVCFGCHFDDIHGRAVVHEPVGAGNCVICHDPHTTENPKNLRAPVNITCGMCHPEKYRPDVLTPHPAVIQYGCTICHDPHASDHPFRLHKPIVEMCTRCHDGYDDGYHVVQRPTGGGHPIGGKDDPLREGRELVCTSCHDPHGTENPRMWYRAYQRLALCVECHRSTLAPGTKPGESQIERDAEAAREAATRLEEPAHVEE